jgi:hypothetical protein
MKLRYSEQGTMNVLLVPVIALALLFIAAGSFAAWAFASRQDYKNNSDAKSAAAVAVNKSAVQAEDAKQFAEAAKNPLKPYVGPEAYGSVKVLYPKTWSAYVDTTDSSTPVKAYFHADYVPSTQDRTATYNLRVQVVTSTYSQVLNQYSSKLKAGGVTATPYSLPKVPNVAGTRLSGKIFDSNSTTSGDIILLPMRDKTLEIWTESPSYMADFNTYILQNLTFAP